MKSSDAPAIPILERGRGRSIGLFGGSFNPIHVGHISLARQLRQLAGLDEVWLMVSPQNPMKQNAELLDEKRRFSLTETALLGEEGIKACDYELRLPKPSYTWNTLQHLKEDYPQHQFILLIGGDNWKLFPRWYRAADILREHEIVVYPRRGSDIDLTTLPENVKVVETELMDISSTEIRGKVKNNDDIRGLVPDAIIDEVYRLYK